MKNADYRTNRHSCYLLEYHLVVVTKYRHPVINGAVKDRLIELSHTVIDEYWKCRITAINTDKDHIHIMFEAPPQVQLSKLVNNYKTVTSRMLRKEFAEELKLYYWRQSTLTPPKQLNCYGRGMRSMVCGNDKSISKQLLQICRIITPCFLTA